MYMLEVTLTAVLLQFVAVYSQVPGKFEPLPNREICGVQLSDGRTRSSTGKEADIDEFPWMARLTFDSKDGDVVDFCAGALINNQYVLTAATCTGIKGKKIKIRLGDYDKLSEKDCVKYGETEKCADKPIVLEAEKLISHPMYNKTSPMHDIGLIRLKEKVFFSDYIRPICLPEKSHKSATDGDLAYFSGWGLLDTKNRTRATLKKRTTATVVSEEKCKDFFKDYQKGFKITVDKTILCTMDKGMDISVCSGDAGGPAMFKSDDRWQMDGIVSFGLQCGSVPDNIGANTRVIEYMDWILSNIEQF